MTLPEGMTFNVNFLSAKIASRDKTLPTPNQLRHMSLLDNIHDTILDLIKIRQTCSAQDLSPPVCV